MKLKTFTAAMTTAINEVYTGSLHENCYLFEGMKLW